MLIALRQVRIRVQSLPEPVASVVASTVLGDMITPITVRSLIRLAGQEHLAVLLHQGHQLQFLSFLIAINLRADGR